MTYKKGITSWNKGKVNEIIQGDCLIEMPKLADKSIDMILADLPIDYRIV